MEDELELKINENETIYSDTKVKLEEILGKANSEYSGLLQDFNSQISYIQNDNMLTEEGKIIKCKEIQGRFMDKVNYAALNNFGSLNGRLDIAIKEEEIRKLKSIKGLNADMLPQLIYVNSMINSISNINDADSLESVFKYISMPGNFSDEVINMVHIKAKNLINAPVEVSESAPIGNNAAINKSSSNGANRTRIDNIIGKINKYKNDYSKELKEFQSRFRSGLNQKQYPSGLYLNRDPKQDFKLPNGLVDNQWKNNNPWNK